MAPLYARYRPSKDGIYAAPVVPQTTVSTQNSSSKKRKRPSVEHPTTVPTSQASKKSKPRSEHEKTPPDQQSVEEQSIIEPAGDGKNGKYKNVMSKYQKSSRQAQDRMAEVPQELTEKRELHDLVPIPQPPRARTPEYTPSFSTLPDWLQNHVVVPSNARVPFDELNLSEATVRMLAEQAYVSAFAVQTALLPRLLPHPSLTHLPPNDLCVSAPTGSGKTLGYLLPIIEQLRTSKIHSLRAVIVVPTRELVAQAEAVAKLCAAGSDLAIVSASGNQNRTAEQESLITKGSRYDPERYALLMQKARRRNTPAHFDEFAHLGAFEQTEQQDVLMTLPHHVPTYSAKADILICTPGRLVEHLNSTTGFNLDDLRWLVIDEADRLMDQNFQGFVESVNNALETPSRDMFDDPGMARRRYVRKVILSATMTQDVATLSSLRLRRPTMIVVKGDSETTASHEGKGTLELPPNLTEFAVPVGEGADKPLYLLELLRSRLLAPCRMVDEHDSGGSGSETDDSETSESESDGSETSDSVSDSGKANDSESDDSETSDSETDESESDERDGSSEGIEKGAATNTVQPRPPLILIFTSSTEEASRLEHLLTRLAPDLRISLLSKSSPATSKVLRRPVEHARVIVSTDKASRGLDVAGLTHVINYGMPRSLESYIHRVGRTARAGRAGQAWTLFRDDEGRWFWNEIARAPALQRTGPVERVRIRLGGGGDGDGDAYADGGLLRNRYIETLDAMRELVHGRTV